MGIRTEERATIIQGGLGLAVMLGVVMFAAGSGNRSNAAESLQTLQLVAGLVCGAVSFAIFTQGWILFTDKLSKQRLYSAVLFYILGILSFLNAAGTSGIKLFGLETGLRLSNAFLIISHLLCAARLFAYAGWYRGCRKLADRRVCKLLWRVHIRCYRTQEGALYFDIRLGGRVCRLRPGESNLDVLRY